MTPEEIKKKINDLEDQADYLNAEITFAYKELAVANLERAKEKYPLVTGSVSPKSKGDKTYVYYEREAQNNQLFSVLEKFGIQNAWTSGDGVAVFGGYSFNGKGSIPYSTYLVFEDGMVRTYSSKADFEAQWEIL